MSETGYSVSALARMSGVSVRTLHHYDQIGLLVPRRGDNGYRRYGRVDVRRLQQIMLWRACGMELAQIAQLIDDPTYDERTALVEQISALEQERARLDEAIANARSTLCALERGDVMADDARFAGLKRKVVEDNERTYGRETRGRFGDAVVDGANAALLAMDERTWNDMNALEERIKALLSAAMESGDVTSPAARELVQAHARWLELHWAPGTYTTEAHRGLADGYLADERFKAYYDGACGEGATQFLRDAIHRLT